MAEATIYHPRLFSTAASSYCELARWALDAWGIPYAEEIEIPRGIKQEETRVPDDLTVDTGEACLHGARTVMEYYEARSPLRQKLYPAEAGGCEKATELFNNFYNALGIAVSGWAFSRNSGATTHQRVIEAGFAEVESYLADGRPFLMGTKLTAPDLAFAALAAPALLSSELPVPMPPQDRITPAMQAAAQNWRTRPAGEFILRLYKEHRPQRANDLLALGRHASGRTFKDKLLNFLIQPSILRPVFAILRRWFPILRLGKTAIISRYNDVIEVLKRDGDFSISQINAPKIDKIDGPFILGMDAGPQYDREQAALMQVIRRDDLEGIRAFVRNEAARLIDAARPQGRIDVVNGLARVVPVRLIASYFGILGPDDPTMMRWMRDIFHYIFANLTGADSVLQDALNSAAEMHQSMDAQIARRKSLGKQEHTDDVLGRLLSLQDSAHPWLDDNAVRRNLGGVIVGAVDTTSKFVALALNELLRRPAALAEAQAAARAEDIEAVRAYTWEAVRFNPHHPLQVRYCGREARIAAREKRAKTIPAGTATFVSTISAMFDPEVFTHPGKFDGQRKVEYLHFGYGMHACFGRAINGVQIPELVAALLRLPGLRRAPGSAGQILYDGPFPNRLVLAFD